MARRTAAHWGSIAAGALLIFAWTTESLADPITVPAGLNPGDQYRLAFVTSTTHNAISTDIDDYNAFVTAVAESVPDLLALGTTWTAIASTGTVEACNNTNTNPGEAVGAPIYLLNGTLLVNNNSDLWDGFLDVPLNVDEQGKTSEVVVWTGTGVSGIQGGPRTALGSTQFAVRGASFSYISLWIYLDLSDPGNQASLYAISDTLTYNP
jgi:hypothetical protein